MRTKEEEEQQAKGPQGPCEGGRFLMEAHKNLDGDNEEAVSLRYRVGKRELQYDREKGAAFRH